MGWLSCWILQYKTSRPPRPVIVLSINLQFVQEFSIWRLPNPQHWIWSAGLTDRPCVKPQMRCTSQYTAFRLHHCRWFFRFLPSPPRSNPAHTPVMRRCCHLNRLRTGYRLCRLFPVNWRNKSLFNTEDYSRQVSLRGISRRLTVLQNHRRNHCCCALFKQSLEFAISNAWVGWIWEQIFRVSISRMVYSRTAVYI